MDDENTIGIFYIPNVIARKSCSRHGARKGEACWNLISIGGDILQGVCTKRARNAGYNSKVSAASSRKY